MTRTHPRVKLPPGAAFILVAYPDNADMVADAAVDNVEVARVLRVIADGLTGEHDAAGWICAPCQHGVHTSHATVLGGICPGCACPVWIRG